MDWRILCSQSCGIKEFYLSRSLNTTSHNNPLYSFECGLILRLSCGLLGLGWACGFNKGESQRELAASSRNGFPWCLWNPSPHSFQNPINGKRNTGRLASGSVFLSRRASQSLQAPSMATWVTPGWCRLGVSPPFVSRRSPGSWAHPLSVTRAPLSFSSQWIPRPRSGSTWQVPTGSQSLCGRRWPWR